MLRAVTVLLIVTVGLIVTQVALGATYSPESWFEDAIRVTRRTYLDSWKFGIHPRWNDAGANAIKGYSAQGYRYTQDMHDLNYHMDAYAYYTDFPNPVWDVDDDEPITADWKNEESEMTADSTSFPTAWRNYVFQTKWSHWYYNPCCGYPGWYWDSGSGQIAHSSQISSKPCGLCEWDTYRFSGDYEWSPYPSLNPPSTAAMTSQEPAPSSTDVVRLNGATLLLRPDLSRGIESYKDRATQAAMPLTGTSQAVVTFARAMSSDDVSALIEAGLDLRTLELAALDAAGNHVTYGGVIRVIDDIKAIVDGAAADDADVLGFVAGQGSVTRHAYQSLAADERIYLIDLSLQLWKNAHPDQPALLNDLYWRLAGWE